jgi:aryl-alcohol dehydrogenase-like predicted oxidoreductase
MPEAGWRPALRAELRGGAQIGIAVGAVPLHRRAAGVAELRPRADLVKLEAAEKLAQLAEEAGLSLIHLALAFVINHPAVTSAIIGPRTMEHLESQLGAADVVLTADILDKIDEIVPPGTTLNPADRGYEPPALTDPALRRR